jgi:hypothetical protein
VKQGFLEIFGHKIPHRGRFLLAFVRKAVAGAQHLAENPDILKFKLSFCVSGFSEIFSNEMVPIRGPTVGFLFKGLFGLDGKSKSNVSRTIEYLQQLIAKQTAILAFGPRAGGQLDAAIASLALGTDDVGPFHSGNMPRWRPIFQSGALSVTSGLQRLTASPDNP